MTKIDKTLKKLSELYEFNRKLKSYQLKGKAKKANSADAKGRFPVCQGKKTK